MNIKLGIYNVVVEIVYKNNKNMYFRFDDDASLIVTCPKHTLNDEIFSLIKKNENSLIKMYERALERQKYDNEFWLLGKKYTVIYDDKLEDTKLEGDFIYSKDEDLLEEFIHDKMLHVFNEEINICKGCFNNLPDFRLKTRFMKTRWGVCNRKDKIITLNTELIKKDVDLIDYVIIHEMAHFYEGNHSKKFWAIVEKACPNYKLRRKELRK